MQNQVFLHNANTARISSPASLSAYSMANIFAINKTVTVGPVAYSTLNVGRLVLKWWL
jgi:hypothetical protein